MFLVAAFGAEDYRHGRGFPRFEGLFKGFGERTKTLVLNLNKTNFEIVAL